MKLNLTVAALAAGTSLLFAGTAAAEVTVTTGGGRATLRWFKLLLTLIRAKRKPKSARLSAATSVRCSPKYAKAVKSIS